MIFFALRGLRFKGPGVQLNNGLIFATPWTPETLNPGSLGHRYSISKNIRLF